MVHALELSLPGNDAGPRPDPGSFRNGGGGGTASGIYLTRMKGLGPCRILGVEFIRLGIQQLRSQKSLLS